MLTASQLLQQRFNQDASELQQAFQVEWTRANREFGPSTNDPAVEAARQRRLSGLHARFAGMAGRLQNTYKKRLAGFAEVDQLAAGGQLSANPEEVKQRMIMSPEVERAAFPKEEKGSDSVVEWGRLQNQVGEIEQELKPYRTSKGKVQYEARAWYGAPKIGQHDVTSVGGGLRVLDPKRIDVEGKEVPPTIRDATSDERRRWAQLMERKRVLLARQEEIMKSDPMAARIRLAAMRSPRGYNQAAFGDNAVSGGGHNRSVQKSDPLGLRR